jgi:hypothetical protein
MVLIRLGRWMGDSADERSDLTISGRMAASKACSQDDERAQSGRIAERQLATQLRTFRSENTRLKKSD